MRNSSSSLWGHVTRLRYFSVGNSTLDLSARANMSGGFFANSGGRKVEIEIDQRMAGFQLFDYLICLFGLLGALHNIGLFGRVIGPLRTIIFFISSTVVVYAVTGIFLIRFTGHGTDVNRKSYFFHLLTNCLPIITQLVF